MLTSYGFIIKWEPKSGLTQSQELFNSTPRTRGKEVGEHWKKRGNSRFRRKLHMPLGIHCEKREAEVSVHRYMYKTSLSAQWSVTHP